MVAASLKVRDVNRVVAMQQRRHRQRWHAPPRECSVQGTIDSRSVVLWEKYNHIQSFNFVDSRCYLKGI